MDCSDLPKALLFTVGYKFSPLYIVVAIVLLCIPWLLGMRIGSRRSGAWVPFFVVALIMTIAPSSGFKTALLYERFALFLLPAYAWMFTTSRSLDGAPRAAREWGTRIAMPLLVVACWAVLGFNAILTWRFGQEAADFDACLIVCNPGSGRSPSSLIVRAKLRATRTCTSITPAGTRPNDKGLSTSTLHGTRRRSCAFDRDIYRRWAQDLM